ncbi:hypothetical protein PRIPAC_78351 [Pristionchus pacificus]|uniref:Abnormal cell migration protein 18-like fibronectin type I domain-containing protein n=1 Tax=Pristionchus pacificus TaxID=54126 RepID=A0A2A6BYH2_PRIPA|nr:hypothetical protein PRIPAC_78351 [Pristionchus pacificus]|eukprot:PDM70811.1 hypothetical protein PRIPAC_45015 [Pristionchus pacificus]
MFLLLLPLLFLFSSTLALPCTPESEGLKYNDTYYVFECIKGEMQFVGCITKVDTVVAINTSGVYQHEETHDLIVNCTAPQPTLSIEKRTNGCYSPRSTFVPANKTIIEDGLIMICFFSKGGTLLLAKDETDSCMRDGYLLPAGTEATVSRKFFYRCQPVEGKPSKLIFLSCVTPDKYTKIPVGETREEGGKKYTCKSETELMEN